MPNFDEKTGIRYGVISPHSVGQWAMDKVYDHGTDPYYEYSKNEIISHLKTFCEDHDIDYDRIDSDQFVDLYCENVQNDDGQMDYSDTEYDLHVSGDNFGIFVMRSPYYTYCRDCSPCAPGAGDLDSPVDDPDLKNKDMTRYVDVFGIAHKIAEKTLCLGPEWFDTDDDQYSRKMPYKCYRVDNDQEVI